MKEQADHVFVNNGGTWTDVETVGLSATQVRTYHRLLYGSDDIPSTWVFNDFGHMTCYVYRDRNGKRGQNELHFFPFANELCAVAAISI